MLGLYKCLTVLEKKLSSKSRAFSNLSHNVIPNIKDYGNPDRILYLGQIEQLPYDPLNKIKEY